MLGELGKVRYAIQTTDEIRRIWITVGYNVLFKGRGEELDKGLVGQVKSSRHKR